MSEQLDFVVKVTGRRCEVSGHLVDSTPVEDYEAEFRLGKEFDLSHLYSASWVGLSRFITFLDTLGIRGGLTNVPAHVHRILMILGEFSGSLVVSSVQVEACDLGALHTDESHRRVVVSMDDLVNNGLLRGAFVEIEGVGLVMDSLHVIGRPAFRNANLPRPNFARNWCLTQPEESMFWYNYCYFVRMSIESSALVLASAVRLMEDSLQSMFARLSTLEAFAKAIHPDARSLARGRLLLDLLARLNGMGHSCVADLRTAQEPFRKSCHRLLGLFVERSTTQKSVYAAVQELGEALGGLAGLTSRLDEVGSQTSRGLFSFQERESVMEFLRSFSGPSIGEEKIVTARRKAKLDMSTPVSWEDSLRELDRLMKGLDEEVESGLVALQCYDSIRQVLEHRLAEGTLLTDTVLELIDGGIGFPDARERLITCASQKLATDQEKYAFEFFFPEEYAVRRNMLTGVVTFFESQLIVEEATVIVTQAPPLQEGFDTVVGTISGREPDTDVIPARRVIKQAS